MDGRPTSRRGAPVLGLVVLSGTVRLATASDHRDTPDVELNPRTDRTDVYAFPGSAPRRMILVMNSRAFLTPAGTRGASFARRCNCAAPQRQYDVLSRLQNRSNTVRARYCRRTATLLLIAGERAKTLP